MYLIRSFFSFHLLRCLHHVPVTGVQYVCIMRLLLVCNMFASCACYRCAIRLHHAPVLGAQYVCIMRLLQVRNTFALCACYRCAIRLHHAPVIGVQYVVSAQKNHTNTFQGIVRPFGSKGIFVLCNQCSMGILSLWDMFVLCLYGGGV